MSSDSEHLSSSDVDDMDLDYEVGEQSAEPDIASIEASEIPTLVEGLGSADLEVLNASAEKLTQVIGQQANMFHELVLPHVPHFFKLVEEKKHDQDRRMPLVELLSQIAMESDQGSLAVRQHLDFFVGLLLQVESMDRFSVLRALEYMLAQDDSFEADLVPILAAKLFAFPANVEVANFDIYSSVIEAFQWVLLYQEEHLRTACAKAGAFEFVVTSTGIPDPKTREAACRCLETALASKQELHEHCAKRDGDLIDIDYFHGMFVLPVLDLLKDEDYKVVQAALDFLQADDTQQTGAFVCTSDDAPCYLVLALAKKDPGVLGAVVDWLLARYAEIDSDTIARGFRRAFTDDDISVETKLGVLRGLTSQFDTVKRAAGKAGAADLVLRVLDDVDHRAAVLSFLPKILEDDSFIAHNIVKNGGIPRLLNVFEQGADIEERCLAASALRLLPQANCPAVDDEDKSSSFRVGAATALSSDDILPRIVSALTSPELRISAAAFELLAEILKTDDIFDEDTPAPIKDRIVTPKLVDLAISKLKVPELAPSALEVLVEACWAYKRGFDITQKAFQPYISQADSAFFAALYGESPGSRFVSRKRHRVADAAVNAGALPRMLQLLEDPITSIEFCRTTVEAFRTLLCADAADREVGRVNTRFPVLLAHLIADGAYQSLLRVAWAVRLLSDEENPKALVNWADALANEATVNHLIAALSTELIQYAPPVDELPAEDFQALGNEYKKKVEAEEERFKKTVSIVTEIISGLLPLLEPFNRILAGALLTRSNTCDESCVVELLNKLASASTDESSLAPLVSAAKELLALDDPPTVEKLDTWIGSDPCVATAFYLAGVLPFLLDRAAVPPPEDGDEPDYSAPSAVIEVLVKLAIGVKGDDSRKQEVQKAFFTNPTLLSYAVNTVKNLEEYEKYTALVMAKNLYRLTQSYPDALSMLIEHEIFPSLLKMFDDDDLDAEDSSLLLGLIAETDKTALIEVIKAQLAQLKPSPDSQGGGKGGKKKRKKGKYTPRISKEGVLLRLAVLSSTSSAAREAVIDAGGAEFSAQTLEGDDSDLWGYSLKCLQALVDGRDPRVHALALPLISRIATIWKFESTPEDVLPPLMKFLQAFITVYDTKPLLEAEWDLLLVRKLSEEPSSVGDMGVLVVTISVLLSSGDAGREAVSARFRERIDDEEALDSEHNWGTTHALRCVADEGEDFAKTILELGALDYALKLLKSDDAQYAIKGAALASTLARRIPAEALPAIGDKGLLPFVAEAKVKLTNFLQSPFVPGEGNTDESEIEEAKAVFEEKKQHMADWPGHLDKFERILSGESITESEYEEYYWF